MELIELIEDGLDYAGKQVGGVQAGDLDAATPCTEWSVRQLLNHLVGSVDVRVPPRRYRDDLWCG